MTSLAIAHLLEQVHLRPLPPVCPPPAIVRPALCPLPRDLVARLAGRRAAERAGDGQAGVRRHRSRSSLSTRRSCHTPPSAGGTPEVRPHRPPLFRRAHPPAPRRSRRPSA